MNRNQSSRSFLDSLPPTGTATKWLCVVVAVVSLVGSLTDRKYGLGTSDLLFSIEHVLQGEWWRILTYCFVERSPFGLLISVLLLWLFGRYFEHKWGARDFLKFCLTCSVGAAVLAIPLSGLIDLLMPFHESGIAEGPDPIFDALLVSIAVTAPNSTILFGFVLPMKSRNVIYLILGFELVSGIMNGAAGISIVLGAMAMGYLLTTGNWRPRKLLAQFQLWRYRRRRKGIHIVPPKDDLTLH